MATKYRNPHALNAKMRHAGYHSSEKRALAKDKEELSTDSYVCMFWKGFRSPKCGECAKCAQLYAAIEDANG
jgi:hypothetical protein